MAQLVVRGLEQDVKEKLRERAKRHKRSMEAEAREILRAAVSREEPHKEGLGTRISRRFAKIGLTEPLERLPDTPPRPASFDD